jgi:hypothetical protein
VIDPREYVNPLSFTAASSLFIVSAGPLLLRIVTNPSTAMASTPHNDITAINTKIPALTPVSPDSSRRLSSPNPRGNLARRLR